MGESWHNTTIDAWIAKGMLSKEFILKRLNERIEEYPLLSSEEDIVKRSFQSACSTEGYLSDAAFISFLQAKSTLPISPEGIQAGKIIYDSLAYLGNLPFPGTLEKDGSRSGLSLEQLTRSLMWLFPDSTQGIIIESNSSRMRTTADHRRLIFQSLASVTHTMPYDDDDARKLAQHGAFEVKHEMFLDMCLVNRDDDGDEIYHDLLDVLYSTQEEKAPWLALVPRDAFRSLAKQIAIEYDLPALYSIGIPTSKFILLVQLLLASQFSSETTVNLNNFEAAARSICATFCDYREAQIITWPAFNRGLKEITPYLFDPIYDMIFDSFVGGTTPFFITTGSEPLSEFSGLLTRPLASQLSTFLIGCVYFGDLRCWKHYSPSSFPIPSAFIEAVETVPDEALIVLSGTTRLGELFTFGVFSPKPKADGASIQTNIVPNVLGLEPCSIFQLAPAQDIFRGIPGKPGWIVDNETVNFGQDDGVAMVFTETLHRGEVRHQVPEEPGTEVVYRPNNSRGSWTVEFEISQIEIWSEIDSDDEESAP